MDERRWRRRRALILRSRGTLYRVIGESLGVTKGRAKEIAIGGARDYIQRTRTGAWRSSDDVLARGIWCMRMLAFNRHVSRAALMRRRP